MTNFTIIIPNADPPVVESSPGLDVFTVYSAIIDAWAGTGRAGVKILQTNTRYWEWETRADCVADYPTTAGAEQYTTIADLNTALAGALPGEKYYLADGSYQGTITIPAGRDGTGNNPITVFAETRGGVTLTAPSRIDANGDFIDVWGFSYAAGTSEIAPLNLDGADCRAILIHINGVVTASQTTAKNWINLNGNRSRLCFSTLQNKSTNGNSVRTKASSTYPVNCRIDHNKIVDHAGMTSNSNGYECIRFGCGGVRLSGTGIGRSLGSCQETSC